MPQRVSTLATLALVLGMLLAPLSMHPARGEEPLKLVFASELIPLSFEEEGEVRGVLVDIAREAFATRLRLPLEIAIYPWERSQQIVQRGEADGFITIATPARELYANCGRIPVLRTPLHPLVRQDHPRRAEIAAARSLAELRPFNIVSYSGNGWAKANLVDFDVYYAADFPASLRGLAQGRGDLALVSTVAGPYALRELNLAGKLVMLPLVVDTFEYVLCLGKKSPHRGQLAEFERVLEVMRLDGGIADILKRYGFDARSLF